MMASRFLALCATLATLAVASIVTGCGGDNGSNGQDVAEDTFVGDDISPDSNPNPDVSGDDVEGCVPVYYIRGSDGICVPPTDTSDDDSASSDSTETTEDVCVSWAYLEGTQWTCGSYVCDLTLWIDEAEDGEHCVVECPTEHLFGWYAEQIQWEGPNAFTLPNTPIRCVSTGE